MGKFKSSEYPAIVIRPSGIWNSRAPFHDYLNYHRLINRAFHIQILAIEKLDLEAEQLPLANPARGFFKAKKTSKLAGRSWHAYKRSFPRPPNEPPIHPTVKQVLLDLQLLIPAFTEYAIISYSSLFEAYIQCWALNHLLSVLENDKQWTQEERHLAMSFCPILNDGHIPTVLKIGTAIPFLVEGLSKLPHVQTNQENNNELESPITPNLNAWRTILFWRDWRNLLIHRSGLISRQFFDKHYVFYEEYKANYPFMPDLRVGEKLELTDSIFIGIVATHYKASIWANQQLEINSVGKRGHPYAPNKKPEGKYWVNPPLRSPLLLLEGDQEQSLQWVNDKEFRTNIITKYFGTKVAGYRLTAMSREERKNG